MGAQSAYALYRAKVMPGIVAENETKEGDAKLAMGDITKKVSKMWTDLPEEEKKPFIAKAEEQKEAYIKAQQEFKTGNRYRFFMDQRKKIKEKENKELRLRDLPKRPKSVFAMFAEEHKKEVEPGKGEGKGRDALNKLWQKQDAEKKAV